VDKEQKNLWKQLMETWDSGHIACQHYIARVYIEKYSSDIFGWVVLGDVLGSLAQYQAARSALSHALKRADDSNRAFVHHQIGHLYRKKGDHQRAESWYRSAVEMKATTSNLVFLGACLAKQGKYAEAKQCHQQAIDLETENPDEAHFNLGLIFRAEGNYQEALKCFEKAIKLDSDYTLAIQAKEDIMICLKMIEQDS
jgi:tetratricopeptide (TPR) repeat protein